MYALQQTQPLYVLPSNTDWSEFHSLFSDTLVQYTYQAERKLGKSLLSAIVRDNFLTLTWQLLGDKTIKELRDICLKHHLSRSGFGINYTHNQLKQLLLAHLVVKGKL